MFDSIINNIEGGLNNFVSGAGNWFYEHTANIIVILLIGYIARKITNRAVSGLIRKTVRRDLFPSEHDRNKRIETLEDLLSAVVRIAIWIIFTVMLIDEIGIDTTALIASAGVLGVALGFGAQSLIKDFTSGIFIISEDQYRVGDVVNIAGVVGTVDRVTVRTTVLRDFKGSFHYVPNGVIDVTTNMTSKSSFLYEEISVGINTDIGKLEQVINQVGEQLMAKPELKEVIIKPPVFLRVSGFGNNGQIVKAMGETKAGEQWKVQGEFYRLLKKELDKNKIHISYPPIVIQNTAKK